MQTYCKHSKQITNDPFLLMEAANDLETKILNETKNDLDVREVEGKYSILHNQQSLITIKQDS
jgi:hypothetical protein